MIIAHNQLELLKKLLQLIDHEDNDIILHIDIKSSIKKYDLIPEVKKGRLYFTEQTSITWAGYSMINAELLLLEKALDIGRHDYYHLLSGVDLPLKPIDKINEFYNLNRGKEFVHMCSKEFLDANKWRIDYKYFLKEKYNRKTNIYHIMDRISVYLQKLFKKKNKQFEGEFCLGSQWFDITEELAKYILQKKKMIKRIYEHSFCCDEAFVQTLVWNSEFKEKLYISEYDSGMMANMRYIDFSRGENGGPRTLRKEDMDEVLNSGLLFARKFNFEKYPEAVELVEKICIVR